MRSTLAPDYPARFITMTERNDRIRNLETPEPEQDAGEREPARAREDSDTPERPRLRTEDDGDALVGSER
jgi:hypothetical protein